MISQGWFVVLCMTAAGVLYILYEVLYFTKEYYYPKKGCNKIKKRDRDISKIKIMGDYGYIDYGDEGMVPVDIQKLQKYYKNNNKFHPISLFGIKSVIYNKKFKYISKDEYLKIIDSQKPCDCLAGNGHEITVAGIYDIEEEFKSLYKEEYICKIGRYGLKAFKNGFYDQDIGVLLHKKAFEIKACLICKKCVSDEQKMYNYFDKIINEVDSKIKDKLKEAKKQSEIYKICGKIA